jgi:hypothetical protein
MMPGSPFGLAEVPTPPEQKTVPFDYAFRFNLSGETLRTHRQKITVSVESPFTAVSIGYGVIPSVQPIRFGPIPSDFPPPPPPPPFLLAGALPLGSMPTNLGDIRLSHVAVALNRIAPADRDLVLKHGFRLNPDVASLSLSANMSNNISILGEAFEAIAAPPERIQFTYALFDDGSGREFQSAPILNTAGLGTANGERPFRHLARPITFVPLSVIRMEITELSTVPGELHVSLQGYKMLGGTGTPTGRQLGRVRRRRRR